MKKERTTLQRMINWFERQESEKQDEIMLKFRLENNLFSLDFSNEKEHTAFFTWLLVSSGYNPEINSYS